MGPVSYDFGPFRLDCAAGMLLCAGREVPLTPRAYALLRRFVERPGELLSKQELLDAVWAGSFVEEGNLKQQVATLRRALAAAAGEAAGYVETVPRRGYRFVAPVRPSAGEGPALAAPAPPVVPASAASRSRWMTLAAAVLLTAVLAALAARGSLRVGASAEAFIPDERDAAVSAVPHRAAKRRPPAMPAYEAYVRGRFHWNRRTPVDLRRAVAHYRFALAHDPGYAAAWAGLANGHNLQGHAEEGRWAAERALALDPDLAEAHAALGNVRFFHDWDLGGAERSLRRAIALDPSYATARHWYAFLLVATGRPERALAEIRRARELDPLSPIVNTDLAQILLYARRYAAAERQLAATLQLDQSFAQARYVLATLHRHQGAAAQAIEEYATAARLAGSAMPPRLWPALAGDDRRAALALPELEASVEARQYPLSPYSIAALHLRLGHREEALAWLERAAVERDGNLLMVAVDPDFDALQGEPRFAALLRRMGTRPLPQL